MDVDKVTYINNQYTSIGDNLEELLIEFSQAMDNLSIGWDGASKKKYYSVARVWMEECAELSNRILKLNNILKSNNEKAKELLNRGESIEL